MAFVVEEVYRRPNTQAPWWRGQSVHKRELAQRATAAGDLVAEFLGQTDDPLVAKYEAIWQDRAAWEKWVGNDPQTKAYNDMITAYHDKFGIVCERREYFL